MEDEPTGGVAGVADFTRVGGACGPSKTTGADEAVVESRKGALISSAAREVVLIKVRYMLEPTFSLSCVCCCIGTRTCRSARPNVWDEH